MTLAAGIIAAFWITAFAAFARGIPRFNRLPVRGAPAAGAEDRLPLVSVVLAAKEEEAAIAETIRHLLAQDYPRYEIIAVNDRSADRTGVRLDELKRGSAAQYGEGPARLTVVHVTRLPEGWLGKTHALYQGARQAKGRLLLFTDADVRFAPHALSDAVRYMREQGADHLTLAPAMVAKSFWLRAFVHYFLFSLAMYTMPWLANDDKRRTRGIGIGAFNLMTRDAYERIGTHRAFAHRPDDDLQLGKRVKRAGLKQRFASGVRQLEVEWYPDLGSAVRGLEKNFYSGFGYRLSKAVAAVAGQAGFFLLPFPAIWFSGRLGAVLFGVAILCMAAMYVGMVRAASKDDGRDVWALPFSALLLVYVLVRAVAMTHVRGGIRWRGTFYPLSELRKKK